MAKRKDKYDSFLDRLRRTLQADEDVATHKELFDSFVEHPRYGKYPHFTRLNPETDFGGETFLHWHSPKECRIPNTAVPADVSRQAEATVPVTHYFDVIRKCRECGRPFIFFAREQKHWYEELDFPLDADCIRCVTCRKQQRGLARVRERYEELFHVPERSPEQNLEMADCCLMLIEASLFHRRQTQHVRMLLNYAAAAGGQGSRYDDLVTRLQTVETRGE